MRIHRRFFPWLMGLFTAAMIAALGSPAGAELVANATASSTTPAAHAAKAGKHEAKKHTAKKHKAKRHKAGKHAKKPKGLPLGKGPKEKGGTKTIRKASEIPLAPAWTEAQLNAEPSGNWITSEGGTTGDHYSQLKEINTKNVHHLKAAWMTQLDGSGLAPKYAGEATPVEYKGVIYYVTGADDVFAVSVANGKILWVHAAELPEAVNAVCCGWDNRGVTLAEGKVFTAVLNGSVEALSQRTGHVIWKTEMGTNADGYTVTSAPLYYHGMIFIGPVGAEFAVRGFMEAFNAKTGAVLWKHWNIPGPGEPGHSSWPAGTSCEQCNKEWEVGGATTWNAPTVDDRTGDIYYSTSNPSGDLQGVTRAGDDKWSVSILALHYKTGKLAWGYQEVHHDIWDLDASSQPVMIRAKIKGKMVEGIDQNNKDGYSYFVDAKNGKPVFPIPEVAVPQNATVDATSPTEPLPSMPPFQPLKLNAAGVEELQKMNDEQAAKEGISAPTVTSGLGLNGDDLFYPWNQVGEETTTGISSIGAAGDREGVPSFDPVTGDMFVCSVQSLGDAVLTTKLETPNHTEGFGYTRASEGLIGNQAANSATSKGYETAYNMHTGKIMWRDEWPHECYYGNTTTAGGLMFAANFEGEELAIDTKTGKELWHFDLGAGGAIATAFEFKGKEYVSVYAGGNEEGDITRGDNLWTFKLNGHGPHGIALEKTPPPKVKIKE
jgi:quinohemoprotein ethanol dehydrogenase